MNDHIEKKKTNARQGETGHNVRYVLTISFALAAIALLAAYLALFY